MKSGSREAPPSVSEPEIVQEKASELRNIDVVLPEGGAQAWRTVIGWYVND
jgi:hypothetical protein